MVDTRYKGTDSIPTKLLIGSLARQFSTHGIFLGENYLGGVPFC